MPVLEFNETANEQRFEVCPLPSAQLNSANWNWLLSDATTDYPESLDPKFRQAPAGDRYESVPTRLINGEWTDKLVRECWEFDSSGKVGLTRAVQFCTGTNGVFDLDDFATSAVKFCLHGLNLFLKVRVPPSSSLPEELKFFLSASNLNGKMLENYEQLLDKRRGEGRICRTSGNVEWPFRVALRAAPIEALRSLRDELLDTFNCFVAAFAGSGPLVISSDRVDSLFDRVQSELTLKALSAVCKS